MDSQEDIIVDISEARQKFFGCSGKMLLPCPATVAAVIGSVPEKRFITTDLLRKELARKFDVEVTCPAATDRALTIIAQSPGKEIPYWRVLKKNGELIAKFPGGLEGHAALLQEEGFTIDAHGKALKVRDFTLSLVRIGD